MDRFTAMLARLGFRGSSDDDLGGKGQRSSQSTPRMNRCLVRDPNPDGRRSFGSLGSMENYRVRPRDRSWESERVHSLNRSWDLDHVPVARDHDRVPGGCDRSWEVERARGMELLYQSMEREKERRRERGREKKDKSRSRKKKKHKEHREYDIERTRPQGQSQGQGHDRDWNRDRPRSKDQQAEIDAQKLSRERLERRMEELNRQLLEEKQLNRRDKLMVARLQRDMARQKSEGPLRETLMKELERERMLRVDAEQRLREMTVESDNTKSRLKALQDEFKQMEEMVQSVMQYKKKIDELKQEKTTMMINYENNLQKYRTQISHLEHENKILEAEVNKLESQCGNCHLCFNNDLSYRVSIKQQAPSQSDDGEKSKVLLERLKMMEAEKTSLVLENENQRQQYEKCLDEIANQVVAALMSQKTLREECAKLQRRVLDLEEQNRQLNLMFQQRIRFASDSVLQSLSHKGIGLRAAGGTRSASSSASSLPIRIQGGVSQRGPSHFPHQMAFPEHTASPFSEVSLESLQSMCSDYNEQVNCEESLSSPPPWLKDKLFSLASPTSSIASPTQHTHSSSGLDHSENTTPTQLSCETPPGTVAMATGTSVTVTPQHRTPADKSEKDSQNTSLQNPHVVPKIETEFPATNSSPKVKHIGVIYQHKHHELPTKKEGHSEPSQRSSLPLGNSARLNVPPPVPRKPGTLSKTTDKKTAADDASPGQELLKLTDSFHEKYTINQNDGLPHIQNMLDSDSDSDSPSQCQSQHYSVASTVSLNELLERGLDDIQTPSDEQFSSDNFGFADSEDEDKDDDIEKALSMGFQSSLLMNGHSNSMMPVTSSNSMMPVTTSNSVMPVTSPNSMMPGTSPNSVMPVTSSKSMMPVTSSNSVMAVTSPNSVMPVTSPNSVMPVTSLDSASSPPKRKSCSCQTSPSLDEPCALCAAAGVATSGPVTTNHSEDPIASLVQRPSALPLTDRIPITVTSQPISRPQTTNAATVNRTDMSVRRVSNSPRDSEPITHNFESQGGAHAVVVKQKTPVATGVTGVTGGVTGASGGVKVKPVVKPKPAKKPLCVNQSTAGEFNSKAASDSNIKHVPKQTSSELTHQDSPVFSQSSTSPDSAMQQSFSSSSSCDTAQGDRPCCRDDGYSSQSAVSVANGDGGMLSLPPSETMRLTDSFSSSPHTPTISPIHNGYHGDTAEVRGQVQGQGPNCVQQSGPGRVRNMLTYFEAKSEDVRASTESIHSLSHLKTAVTASSTSLTTGHHNGAFASWDTRNRRQLSSHDLSHSESCLSLPGSGSDSRRKSAHRNCGCKSKHRSRPFQTTAKTTAKTMAKSDSNIPRSFRTSPKKKPPAVPKRPASTYKDKHLNSTNLRHDVHNATIPKLPNGTASNGHVTNHNTEVYVGHVMLQEGVPNLASYGLPSLGFTSLGDKASSDSSSGKKLEVRDRCEGCESGYRSEDSGVRPDAIGSEGCLAYYETIPQDSSASISGVRMGHLTVAREPQMSWMMWSSDSEGEEMPVNYVDLWRSREAPAVSLPEWNPKATANSLKQKVTPSPLSCKTIDSSLSAEQWLLGFSKADIEKHTSPERNIPSLTETGKDSVSPIQKLDNNHPWTTGSNYGNEIVYIDPERAAFVDCVKAFNCVAESADDTKPSEDRETLHEDSSQQQHSKTSCFSSALSPTGRCSRIVSEEAKKVLEEISRCKLGLPKQSSLNQSLDELEREYEDLAMCDSYQSSQSAHSTTAGDSEHSQSEQGNTHHDITNNQSKQPETTHDITSSQSKQVNSHDILNDQSEQTTTNHSFLSNQSECCIEAMDISPSTDDTPTDGAEFASALHNLCPQFTAAEAYGCSLPGPSRPAGLSSLAFDWSPVEDDSGFEQAHETERDSADICRQIEDLTRTVDNLQRSLSSLDADSDPVRRYSSSSEGEQDFGHLLPLSPTELNDGSILDPEVRANLLDEMMVSSSSEDLDDAEGTDPARFLLSKFRQKRRRKKLSKVEAIRQVSRPRATIDHNHFVRYSQHEQRAMDSFSFLEEYPSSATQSEDEGAHGAARVIGHRGQGQKRGAAIKLGCGSLEQGAELPSCSPSGGSGYVCPDAEIRKKRSSDSSGDSEDYGLLHPRSKPQHKTVLALKEESRCQPVSNRFSNASFDSQTSYSGLSLSDSCCESFSSSNPSINDVTFL